MITPKTAEALNKHLNAELYSSYLYLSMSAYASYKGLSGAANWLNIQVQEEAVHVRKMYDYINDQGAQVILDVVEKPPTEFGSMLDLFEAVLVHEQKVTALINDLMTRALQEADHATQTFLQWFVIEQTEEEKSVKAIIDRLKLAGPSGPGIFMIDNELAARVLTPSAP